MGRPDLCTQENIRKIAKSGEDIQEGVISAQTLLANSCVMRSVVNLVDHNFKRRSE